ncbi:hypothetical protein [Mucilaginibacter aquariorum]|uniref:Uncharacterized protein n=1 Tax=Mucilaginibacter aquariorum TaxID=2967225 RepID=A0ABT1T320_9SPHI|nr:hypothetical protein [Mucilaginibacter aquariorum]MCQ6959009.1 hypothetical protein [Mucilaginibacter aquariorum]
METFKTQFKMGGVPTDVTVKTLMANSFDCTLNLADFFDGGEFEGTGSEPDFTLKHENGKWQIVGDSKVTLTEADINNLGQAIDEAYLGR